MPKVKSVREAEVAGKRVLVRCDFDIPLADGKVADDARLKAALPTLELLHERGATLMLLGHAGRPAGKVIEEMRLAPIETRLRELTHIPFEMRENLRFDPREEGNDDSFAQELAAQGDLFVNEAFADSHRAHASIVGIPKFLPSFAGLRFAEEVEKLQEASRPPAGSLAIIGGAKFETKVPLLRSLLQKYGEVLVGGALGNDLLKARGLPFGLSLISDAPVPEDIAGEPRLLTPTDAVLEDEEGGTRTGLVVDVRAGERIVDIGPHTAMLWAQKISAAPFVVWSGPMGMYEKGHGDGTDALARAIAKGPRAIVGGGDTVAALQKSDLGKPALRSHLEKSGRIFVSTGGGAMLQFLARGTLPGVDALTGTR